MTNINGTNVTFTYEGGKTKVFFTIPERAARFYARLAGDAYRTGRADLKPRMVPNVTENGSVSFWRVEVGHRFDEETIRNILS